MPETPNKSIPLPPQLQGMSAADVAELMERVIRAIKEPSDEEKEKKAAELERKKEFARQAQMAAEQELKNRMAIQANCNHRNDRYHTFVAQNTGNGDTVALCQICGLDVKWATTADQLRQGVNLLEYRGLTLAHLLDWEKKFPATGAPPDRIKLLMRAGKKVEWPPKG